MPQSGIRIGRNSLIGEYSIIRGQGGVTIGDRVYTSPFTQILAVNHVVDDPDVPFTAQGITAEGIVVEDDVWLGAGCILTDGVHVEKGRWLLRVQWSRKMFRPIPLLVAFQPIPLKRLKKDNLFLPTVRSIFDQNRGIQ